ncbi:hypothetical protein HG535_0G02190 [Zygotorulaspora mrakii]|uniref:Uncharacterized protein n=1 Tax=Zygotorulaspora mrakii TaxID=42260 RepID=A0A7H9B6I3_ZYGMR|nr:uncharacterized protein HG535_0G02190 [Zygotorulaspora mrakii]QLG74335.1 hypothetical protein HG535_0G02190 [Zygotorulaspora mrakii]
MVAAAVLKEEPKSADPHSTPANGAASTTATHEPTSRDTTATETNTKAQRKERVIPWEATHQQVDIKTFTGYDLKLDGWIRQDVLNERRHKAASPSAAAAVADPIPADEVDDEDDDGDNEDEGDGDEE